jgi:hypothetical protein
MNGFTRRGPLLARHGYSTWPWTVSRSIISCFSARHGWFATAMNGSRPCCDRLHVRHERFHESLRARIALDAGGRLLSYRLFVLADYHSAYLRLHCRIRREVAARREVAESSMNIALSAPGCVPDAFDAVRRSSGGHVPGTNRSDARRRSSPAPPEIVR